MTDVDRTRTKLAAANRALGAGLGTLSERLREAFIAGLLPLDANEHFPWPDLRNRFSQIMTEFDHDGYVKADVGI